jgi:hypothetical protein
MDYTISKTKRNLLLFSVILLILKATFFLLVFQSAYPAKPDLVLILIGRILQIAAYGYILIVLIDYFKHYELKVLKMITLCILVLEIAENVIQNFSSIQEKNTPNHANFVVAIGGVLALITWIIFLFRIRSADFPGLGSIRKYAVSLVTVVILGAFIPVFIDARQYFEFLAPIIVIIPYFFIIEFALKLNLKSGSNKSGIYA